MLAKDSVKQRIAELQTRNIAKQDQIAAITTESLLAEAEAARVLAMKEKQPSAAIAAIAAKGKLCGLWVERAETAVKTDDLNTLSDAQLAAIIKREQPDKPPLN